MTDQYRKYGRIYGIYTLFNKALVINEPKLLKEILVNNFHIFSDKRKYNFGESAIKYSIFLLPGDHNFKRIRSIISPAFTSAKLRAMCSSISNISDNLINNLQKLEKNGMKSCFI